MSLFVPISLENDNEHFLRPADRRTVQIPCITIFSFILIIRILPSLPINLSANSMDSPPLEDSVNGATLMTQSSDNSTQSSLGHPMGR